MDEEGIVQVYSSEQWCLSFDALCPGLLKFGQLEMPSTFSYTLTHGIHLQPYK